MLRPLPYPAVLSLSYLKNRDSFTHPVETYDNWFVLGCQTGAFESSVGQRPWQRCEPAQLVVCPPGEALRRRSFGRLSFYFFRFDWKSSLAAEWHGTRGFIDLHRMQSTLNHLERLDNRPIVGESAQWANHLLADIFNQLRHEQLTARPAAPKEQDPLMIRTAERIRSSMNRPDSLEHLAEALQLSPSQFTRRFSDAFGVTPSIYRTRLRMREARRMLIETTLKLQAIAEACGYENAFYFSRMFARENGVSPGQYRKSRGV
ncbi:hypothetical protein BH10PLA1_BH10PLA1_17580 [soil metagenome]